MRDWPLNHFSGHEAQSLVFQHYCGGRRDDTIIVVERSGLPSFFLHDDLDCRVKGVDRRVAMLECPRLASTNIVVLIQHVGRSASIRRTWVRPLCEPARSNRCNECSSYCSHHRFRLVAFTFETTFASRLLGINRLFKDCESNRLTVA